MTGIEGIFGYNPPAPPAMTPVEPPQPPQRDPWNMYGLATPAEAAEVAMLLKPFGPGAPYIPTYYGTASRSEQGHNFYEMKFPQTGADLNCGLLLDLFRCYPWSYAMGLAIKAIHNQPLF